MQEKVKKFRKFDQENEKKRARALAKYTEELRLVEQKTSELDLLTIQREELEEK